MRGKLTHSRRNVIKKMAALGTGVVGAAHVSSPFVMSAKAASINDSWQETAIAEFDECGSWDYRIGSGLNVGFYGATWDSVLNRWEFVFKENTCSASEYACDGNEVSIIKSQEMYITESGVYNLSDYVGDKFKGVTPKLSTNPYGYDDLIWDLTSIAVSEVSQVANFALTTADVLSGMHSNSGNQKNDYGIHHIWDYYGKNLSVQGDVSNYRWWSVHAPDDERGIFDIASKVNGQLDTNTAIYMTFECPQNGSDPSEIIPDEPLNSGQSKVQADENKSIFLDERALPDHYSGWNIEVIPRDNVDRRAKELGLPREHVESVTTKSDPMFFAHSPPVSVTSTETRSISEGVLVNQTVNKNP